MGKRVLNFQNFTVKFDSEKNRISLVIYRSDIPKEGTVTGFRFDFFSEIIIRNPEDERSFVRWMKREFPSILRSDLLKTFRSKFPLNEHFPYLKSYDVKVKVSEDINSILFFEVLTEVEVSFSKGVSRDRFDEDLKRFVSENFDFLGLPNEVNETIEYIIYYDQPQTDFLFSTQTSPPSRIQIVEGRERTEFNFPEVILIHIYLKNPPSENVLNTLMNSSDEKEFIIKLSLLITDENVENVTVVSSSQDDKGIRDIKDVLNFLREVTGWS